MMQNFRTILPKETKENQSQSRINTEKCLCLGSCNFIRKGIILTVMVVKFILVLAYNSLLALSELVVRSQRKSDFNR